MTRLFPTSRSIVCLASALVLAAVAVPAHSDEDSSARIKEMLRRTQEALRQAQSDNEGLQTAKADAEQKLAAANQQLQALQSGSKAAEASLNAKLSSAEKTQDDVAKRLAETAQRLTTTDEKLAETSKQLATRSQELADTKKLLEQSASVNASCETKNLTLYRYSEELLKKYRSKGVWASLSQKEPVFGLEEVGIENVIQEYQTKLDAEKINR